VYTLTFSDDIRYSREELLAILNSSVSEFLIKTTSPPLRGRPFRYRYKTKYIENLPVPAGNSNVGEVVRQILEAEKLQRKIEYFPDSYTDQIDSDLEYIDYEWQTRRYPVNADIQEKGTEDRFAVTAGRSDEITDPLIDRGNREERKLRAKFVHAAVDGRNMKKGEEQSIPVPLSRSGVEQLIEALETDRQTVEETSIEDLEAEIDQTVYDLFDLTEEEQEVIEDYLEVF
jgi:hypothetical protein